MNKIEAAFFYGNYNDLLLEIRQMELSENPGSTNHNRKFSLELQSPMGYNNINQDKKGIVNSDKISDLIL